MVNIMTDDRQSAYGIRHFIADEEKDVPTISIASLNPGSTVFVINNSKTFMLNGSKLWVEIKTTYDGGGDKPSPADHIYDGGGVVPGTIPPSLNKIIYANAKR